MLFDHTDFNYEMGFFKIPGSDFNKEIRDKVFPLDKFDYYYFKSIDYYESSYTNIDSKKEKDACLVYKKVS